ncbi:MAG: DUF1553 domain-containing protein [Bacteroidota bacterium]|nr:DUF1553 domain-containing protein [Bacteroidota bacterium]
MITTLRFQILFLLFILTILLHLHCSKTVDESILIAKADSLPQKVDFNLHIRPILSDKCFNCHGPDEKKREAGLRLDNLEGATTSIEGRKPISPGNLSKSEVFHRIMTTDKRLIMPLHSSNLVLSDLEKATIAKWIKQGAEYKPLWSLLPIEVSNIPEVKNKAFVKNEIDNFILQKMEFNGLNPSKEAPKEVLIRRLSLDITGLPPTIEAIDSFLNDNSANAYEKQVDKYLKSPHYGEKMAYDWMDVARYADSHGYQDDGYRNSYHWRDYVINSFNQNKPYNEFTIEQIAGDLLPYATKDQLIATGFNRNHAQNKEGGIIDEEFRVEYVLDRVNTIGKAYLGLTVECARCHDHKFDPITRKHYYELSAFFNKGNEAGWIPNFATPGPTLTIYTKLEQKKLDSISLLINEKQKELSEYMKQNQSKVLEWKKNGSVQIESGLKALFHFDTIKAVTITKNEWNWSKNKMENKKIKSTGELNAANKDLKADINIETKIVKGRLNNALELIQDKPIYLYDNQGIYERYEDFTFAFWINPKNNNPQGQIIFSRAKSIYDANAGFELILDKDSTLLFRMIARFRDNMIEIKSNDKIDFNRWNHIALSYDGSSKAKGVKLYNNGKLMETKTLIDGLTKGFKLPYVFAKRYKEFISDGKGNFDYLKQGDFKIGAQDGNYKFPSISKAAFDEFYIYSRELVPDEIKLLSQLKNPIQIADTKSKDITKVYFETSDLNYIKLKKELIKLKLSKNEIETNAEDIMISADGNNRTTYMLERGVYDAHGDTVSASTPQVILPFDNKKYPKNRLGLAQWIVDKDNPLTPRVTVNRYWQIFFGQGIVTSSGDFGNQGSLPSHPELLDYLASELVNSNWNIKNLVKKIVMSHTYRQSSKIEPQMLQKDPYNTFYSRAPRFRLPFELIRDQALAASGILNDTIGGLSVFPYQPANLWEEKTSGRFLAFYTQSHGKDLYRRSLYTFFKRSAPPPTIMTFDASDRSYCTVKKSNTNTPLQALVLLNDPQLLEAARVFAEKIVANGGNTLENRITYAFRLITSRTPTRKEIEILVNQYQYELARFKNNPKQVAGFLNNGEYGINRKLNPFELAAFSVIAHTLLNLDEVINKS